MYSFRQYPGLGLRFRRPRVSVSRPLFKTSVSVSVRRDFLGVLTNSCPVSKELEFLPSWTGTGYPPTYWVKTRHPTFLLTRPLPSQTVTKGETIFSLFFPLPGTRSVGTKENLESTDSVLQISTTVVKNCIPQIPTVTMVESRTVVTRGLGYSRRWMEV